MSETESGALFILKPFLNVLTHVLIGIIFYEMIHRYWPYIDSSTEFVIHAYFCTIGIILLMGEGFLIFSPDNVLTNIFSRDVNRKIHFVLFTLGTLFTSIGVIVEIAAKDKRLYPSHFESSHAITGLVSTILLIVTCFGGLFVVFNKQLSPCLPLTFVKLIHYLIGIIGFIVGIASYALVYQSNEVGYIVIVSLICVLTLIQPLISLFNMLQNL